MISVSYYAYKKMKESRRFLPYIDISFTDGKTLNLGPENFSITGNTITTSKEDSVFPVGQVISNSIELYIINEKKYSYLNFYKAKLKLYFKFIIDEEYITEFDRGFYTVITAETQGELIHIVASDDVYKLDKPYVTKLEFPATIRDIMIEATENVFAESEYPIYPKDNYLLYEKVYEKPDLKTYRELFSCVAKLDGSYVYNKLDSPYSADREGVNFNNIELFIPYINYDPEDLVDGGFFDYEAPYYSGVEIEGGSFSPWNMTDDDDGNAFGGEFRDELPVSNGFRHIVTEFKNLVVDTDDIEITGVRAVYGHNNWEELRGKEGYIIDIDNPLLREMEHSAVTKALDNNQRYIGSHIRRFQADFFSDPLIEFGDSPIIVNNNNGMVFRGLLTDVNYNILGYTSVKSEIESVIENQRRFNLSKNNKEN